MLMLFLTKTHSIRCIYFIFTEFGENSQYRVFSTDELVQLFGKLITILASFDNTTLAAREIKLNYTLSSISYSHTVIANVILNGSGYSLRSSNKFMTDVICLF